jgi:Flp pilus assembly pilin Flp
MSRAGPLDQSVLAESNMNTIWNLARRLAHEEQGGEVLEYALIAGLIVVAAIGAIAAVGSNVLARWNSLSGSSL